MKNYIVVIAREGYSLIPLLLIIKSVSINRNYCWR